MTLAHNSAVAPTLVFFPGFIPITGPDPHVDHPDLIPDVGILTSVPSQTFNLPTLQTLQSQQKMLVLHHSQPNPELLYPMMTIFSSSQAALVLIT